MRRNRVSQTLLIIGIIEIIICFIMGIAAGQSQGSYGEFNFMVAFIWWIGGFVTGMLFVGFAEIIKLLQEIRDGKGVKIKTPPDYEVLTEEKVIEKGHPSGEYHLSFENRYSEFKGTLKYYGNEFTITDSDHKLIHTFKSNDIIDYKYNDFMFTVNLILKLRIKDETYSYKVLNTNNKNDVANLYNDLNNILM